MFTVVCNHRDGVSESRTFSTLRNAQSFLTFVTLDEGAMAWIEGGRAKRHRIKQPDLI